MNNYNKSKKLQKGSFCKGHTTTYCDFHEVDSKVGSFKKGDQKLRKLIIIKNFQNKFFLVQFIGNNQSKPELTRTLIYKTNEYHFNLQNCYIIPKSHIDHSISFIPNQDFKWIKKDCLDYIESKSKRKNVYDKVLNGELNQLTDKKALDFLNEEQFSEKEKWNRNSKKDLIKRIKLYQKRIFESEKTIEFLQNKLQKDL